MSPSSRFAFFLLGVAAVFSLLQAARGRRTALALCARVAARPGPGSLEGTVRPLGPGWRLERARWQSPSEEVPLPEGVWLAPLPQGAIAGRRVRVSASLRCQVPPRNPASEDQWQQAFRGPTFFARPRGPVTEVSGAALPDVAATLRRFLERQTALVPRWQGVVVATWTGATEGLPEALLRTYRELGLLPVLALSGQHVLVLALLVQLALRLLSFFFRRSSGTVARFVPLGASAFLLLSSGAVPSMVRTFAMACAFTALRQRRMATTGVQILASSVAILLFVDPAFLAAPGFLLSVAGTALALQWAVGGGRARFAARLGGSLFVAAAMLVPCAYLFGRGNLFAPLAAIVVGSCWEAIVLPLAFATPLLASLPWGLGDAALRSLERAWTWAAPAQVDAARSFATYYGVAPAPSSAELLALGVGMAALCLSPRERSLPVARRCNTIVGNAAE